MSIDVRPAYLAELRTRTGVIDQAELATAWSRLDTIRPEQLLGSWHGGLFDTGHPFNRRTEESHWHGKRFTTLDDARPDVCIDSDGQLYTSGSGGSLWMIEFRHQVTAALIYDDQPVLDHFKCVDETTVLGVMNRTIDRETDTWLYFWLDREPDAVTSRNPL
ncbi:MAG: DUF4334 domain-containing protein [Nakamurella sp.]